MKILLIEDSDTVASVVIACLNEMFKEVSGFELIRERTLQDGKDRYLTFDPHIVMLDLTLDTTQSVTICEIPHFSIRSDVVIVSGDSKPSTRHECFSRGAHDYLDKKRIIERTMGTYSFMRYTGRMVSAYLRCLYGARKSEQQRSQEITC
jgi:DNA-binding response OmpR family regulator